MRAGKYKWKKKNWVFIATSDSDEKIPRGAVRPKKLNRVGSKLEYIVIWTPKERESFENKSCKIPLCVESKLSLNPLEPAGNNVRPTTSLRVDHHDIDVNVNKWHLINKNKRTKWQNKKTKEQNDKSEKKTKAKRKSHICKKDKKKERKKIHVAKEIPILCDGGWLSLLASDIIPICRLTTTDQLFNARPFFLIYAYYLF